MVPEGWHFYNPKTGEEIKETMVHNKGLYHAINHLHKGGLHKVLHVPEGEKIPAERLEAARHSTNSHVKHMADFAHVLGGFHHGS
jgi:hypothetical protein